jgi:hypothetical protein
MWLHQSPAKFATSEQMVLAVSMVWQIMLVMLSCAIAACDVPKCAIQVVGTFPSGDIQRSENSKSGLEAAVQGTHVSLC